MTTSTINTSIPATGSPVSSAPVRNNFVAAANDINNIYSLIGGGSGTVTAVSATPSQGVTATVTNATTTPNIAIGLGAITPSSVLASGTVGGSNLSGTNTGDQTIVLSGAVGGSGTGAITTTLQNGVVHYNNIQNVAAVSLIGNPTGSGATTTEIPLGSGLSFSGGSLVATGSGGTVTSIATNNGIAGGTITSTGTIGLASVANNDILANITGSSNPPSANTLSAVIDSAIGNTQGDILYRDASAWKVLAPGTSGYTLHTEGAGSNPTWSPTGTGSVSTVSVVTANGVSGSVANPTTTPAITLTLGDISAAEAKATGATTLRTLASKFSDVYSAYDLGLVGSGDEASTFAAALAACAGRILDLEGLTITIGSQVSWTTANVWIRNGTINCTYTGTCLYAHGSLGTAYTPSVSMAVGDTSITFASAPGFVAGDLLFIQSADSWAPVTGNGEIVSQWATVLSTASAGTVVNLTAPLDYAFTTSINVYKPATLNNLILENITFTGLGLNNFQVLFEPYLCRVLTLYNCQFLNTGAIGFNPDTCYDVKWFGLVCIGAYASGTAYGVSVSDGCEKVVGYGTTGGAVRHLISVNGIRGINRHCQFFGTIGEGCRDAIADTHPAADMILYDGVSGNVISNNQNTVYIRGARTIVKNTHFTGALANIEIQPTTIQNNDYMEVDAQQTNYSAATSAYCFAFDNKKNSGVIDRLKFSMNCTNLQTQTSQFPGMEIINETANNINSIQLNLNLNVNGTALYISNNSTGKIKNIVFDGVINNASTTAPSIYLDANALGDIDNVTINGLVIGGNYGVFNHNNHATNVRANGANISGYATAITSGTVNLLLSPAFGGTGVNNGSNTITIGGNLNTAGAFSTSGAHALIATLTADTNVTFPTSGTLSTTTGTVTAVSIATANGVSGSVANPTTTPAITLTLGDISGAKATATGGSASRTFAALLGDYVSVLDFTGVLGNGSNDDTAGLQAGMVAGGKYYFPSGHYILSGNGIGIFNASNTEILFGPNVIIDMIACTTPGSPNAFFSNNVCAFSFWGAIGSPVSLTADAAQSALTITVASVAGLSVGNWIYLQSTTKYETDTNTPYGEFAQIQSINSGTKVITLWEPLYLPYTTAASATIKLMTFAQNIKISGQATILGGNLSGAVLQLGLQFVYCQNVQINDITINYTDHGGISLLKCLHGTINKVTCTNMLRLGNAVGLSMDYGTTDVDISECTGSNMYHLVDCDGDTSSGGITMHIKAHHCYAYEMLGPAFNAHDGTRNVDYSHNIIYMVDGLTSGSPTGPCGIRTNGAEMTAIGNQLFNICGNGVFYQPSTQAPVTLRFTAIGNTVYSSPNNSINDANQSGVAYQGSRSGMSDVSAITITGNQCFGFDTPYSVYANFSNAYNVILDGNSAVASTNTVGAFASAVVVRANTGFVVSGGCITNNAITATLVEQNIILEGADAASIKYLTIGGNTINGAVYYGLRLDNADYLTINPNIILNCPTPVYLDTSLSHSAINWNSFIGTTTPRIYTAPDANCTLLTTNAVVTGAQGGTGVNNGSNTITVGGNLNTAGAFSTSGAHALIATLTGDTNVTFPTSGTLSTTTGTVTAVSVASSNGFAGSSSGGATPALTLSTSITGVLLGNGTAISASSVTNDVQTKAAIVPNTTPTAGQFLVGNAGGTAYAPVSMSGGATLASSGALTVVTNANLTGVITSSGNATSIGAQTGTGTKFVVDTSPTLVTPTLGVAAATSLGVGSSVGTNNILRTTQNITQAAATVNTILSDGTHTLNANNAIAYEAIAVQPTINQSSFNQTTSLTSGGGLQGIRSSPSVTGASGTVTAACAFVSDVRNTAAGVLTNAVGFSAFNFSNSGGGTLTNAIGFYAAPNTAATNNYGFQGNLAAASNTFNLYMGGTAINYMAGALGVGSSSSVGSTINIRSFVNYASGISGTTYNTYIDGTTTLAASASNQLKWVVSAPVLNQNSYNSTANSSSGSGLTGFYSTPQLSGATGTVTSMSGYVADLRNTAAGTLTDGVGFNAVGPTNSGSGTFTNWIGFYAQAATAATNNYGFYGNLASASNTYNLYMNGTAANYFAGNTSVGSTTTTSLFNVGSSAQFQVNSSGLLVNYNNIATVSNGVPAEYAKIDTTGLTANVAAATLYAVPASGAGMYRVSALVVETTAGSASSTLPNVQIVYTDNDTGGSVTIDATPILGIAGIGQTGALTTNTVGTTSSGVIVINAKASTNIQYQTTNYASSLAGMAYALHIKLESL